MRFRSASLLTAGWVASCVLLFLAARNGAPLAPWERLGEDALLRASTLPAADPRIVIVAVDAASLRDERIGKPPWRPHVYAGILERLNSLGAKAVAFDVVMEHLYESRDQEFARQLEQSHAAVVLASHWATDRSAGGIEERWTLPARDFRRSRSALPHHQTPGVGFINLPLDGELIREACLFRRDPIIEERRIPSLATALALATGDIEPLEQSAGPNSLKCRTGELPVRTTADGAGLCRIHYAGPRGRFRTINVQELLGLVPHASVRDWIAGATVIVGSTAPEFHDLHDTPMNALTPGSDKRMPGVEIHANVLNMLRKGSAPRPCAAATAIAWTVLSALVLTGLTLLARPFAAPILLALWCVLDWGVALWVLERWMVLIPLVAPLCLGIAMWTGCVLIRWVRVHRERTRVRNLFSRCVHESVVDELLGSDADCPEARHRRVTVFFCDIRGFTQLSERLEPMQIAAMLYAHHGAVDKFIGDAIMAFFGTPLHDPDHARHAVECAVEMQVRLRALNDELSRDGLPPLEIGFGISTGTVVAGMLGSSRKMEYTIVGDTVNVASRLESLNKELGTTLLIAGDTRRALPPDFAAALKLEDRGSVSIRGKAEAVHVFSVAAGCAARPGPEDLSVNHAVRPESQEAPFAALPELQGVC
jgi:adenylate cyclase